MAATPWPDHGTVWSPIYFSIKPQGSRTGFLLIRLFLIFQGIALEVIFSKGIWSKASVGSGYLPLWCNVNYVPSSNFHRISVVTNDLKFMTEQTQIFLKISTLMMFFLVAITTLLRKWSTCHHDKSVCISDIIATSSHPSSKFSFVHSSSWLPGQ